MKNAYPIVMTQGKEFVVVFVPDFNINTQGKDIPDAIEMARDAIGLMGIDMHDESEEMCIRDSCNGDSFAVDDGVDANLLGSRHTDEILSSSHGF